MSNPLLVGVDVHRQTNTVCLMDAAGHLLGPRRTIDNNRPGAEGLVHQLAHQMAAGDFDAIQIAAEATGWYWWHFFQTLSHDPTLQQWPLQLYPLNPRLTANFAKTYVDHDHTDLSDAFVIADRLRMGRDLPPPYQLDARYLAVRLLTRYRFHLIHAVAREKAYALAIVYLKASEYGRLKPFGNLFGTASRAVLQEFASLEAIAQMPFDDLVEWLDVRGKRRFTDPHDNARTLQQVARDSYDLPQALQQPVHQILGLCLQHVTFLEGQVKRLDSAIAEQLVCIPHTLETIPGIGPVFAGGIIAEVGDIARFEYDQAKVAKFAGFKWKTHQSGDFTAEETRLSRTGNRFLRYYFCEAANAVRMHDREYGAYYERKYREVRQHQHKRAIVLTARKLVRLVARLLTSREPYQIRRPVSS
jgi:Transposase/Transposase IS116/IS110/IS902 family